MSADAPAPTSERTDDARAASRWHRLRHALLALILISMIPLLESSVDEQSPTSDEWAHFLRGVSYWSTGEVRLSYAHPPLANAIAGLPFALGLDEPVEELRGLKSWERGGVMRLYVEYSSPYYAEARVQLMRARRIMFLFPLLLVTYAYGFCLREFGWITAIAAATLLAYNPTLLAHGALVTTDLPAAFGVLLAVGEFSRYVRAKQRPWLRLVTMALAVSCAMLFKHSGVLLIPIFAVLGAVAAVKGWGVFADGPLGRRMGRWTLHVAATTAILMLASNLVYRFENTGMRVDDLLAQHEPQYWISSTYKQELLEQKTPLAKLPAGLRIPLPHTQIFGLACIRAQNARGWYQSYFWGSKQPNHGHPAYFPTLLLIKTPLVIFALLIVGSVARRERWRPPSPTSLIIGLVCAYLFALMATSRLNMGMRHMLPVIPLLTLLAARGFAHGWARVAPGTGMEGTQAEARSWRRKLGAGALVLSLVGMPVLAWQACPRYLGWFNASVGRETGHWISIIGEDWSQDTLRVARFAQDEGLAPLYLTSKAHMLRREATWAGLEYELLSCKQTPRPGAYIIVRAAAAKTRAKKCYRWMETLEPEYVVNDHMYIYRAPHRRGSYAPALRGSR